MAVVAIASAARIDWFGMQAHPFLRAGALFLIVSLCALTYFATLFAMGFRLRDFKRSAR
jgi:putative peptidoglycan lipid II flippase